MSPSDYSAQFIQSRLRSQLPFFGIASIFLTAGLCALLLAALKSRDRLLFWLGTFSVLYGARLFIQNGLVNLAFGMDDRQIFLAKFCITYVISVPYAVFGRELLGAGWRKSLSAWVGVQIVFALIALPIVVFVNPLPGWLDNTNSILVIIGTLLILLHVLLQRENSSFAKGLAWPLAVFAFFIVLSNTVHTRRGVDFEPLGFLFLLGGLGSTASRRAIDRERKLVEVEQELTTARRIQSSIIPESSPYVPGLRIASRYQPMTAVAGDFFDFLKTGETSVTILVADVSGHGVPAALVASMLKVSFAAQRENAQDPAKVLAGLNAMLRGGLGGQYVTAACASINLAAHSITYAGAGHPPSLLFRAKQGDIVQLAENGLFIGPFAHAVYSNVSVPFEPGDKLLLYTDGIVEACGADGREFGQNNLEQLLLHSRELAPADFIDGLFQAIATPAQQDDLTVVFIQCIASA